MPKKGDEDLKKPKNDNILNFNILFDAETTSSHISIHSTFKEKVRLHRQITMQLQQIMYQFLKLFGQVA